MGALDLLRNQLCPSWPHPVILRHCGRDTDWLHFLMTERWQSRALSVLAVSWQMNHAWTSGAYTHSAS